VSWLSLLNPVLFVWAALAYKLPTLRRNPDDPTLRALCFAFFALGVALTLLLPPVYAWTGSVTGIPHLARLLAHLFGVLNGWALQLLLLHLTHDRATARRRARVRHGVLAATTTLMILLFWQARPDSAATDFLTAYANRPSIVTYLIVFLLYLGYSLFDIGTLSASHSRHARSPLLRTGLRLVALGSLVGLGYPVEKITYVLARLVTPGLPNVEAPLSGIVIVTSVLLVVTGLTLPGWGALVVQLADEVTSRRLHREVLPLRSALGDAFPRTLSNVTYGTPRQRLHREMIEIHDGLLLLRTFHDPADPAESDVTRVPPPGTGPKRSVVARRRAEAEAIAIHDALVRVRANRPTGGQTPVIPPLATTDLLTEARHLAAVSQALARLPRTAVDASTPRPAPTPTPAPAPDPTEGKQVPT
jgi:hypothetical protein